MLEQPVGTPVVTTLLRSWEDLANNNFLDGVKVYPKTNPTPSPVLTQEVKAFGRTGATYQATFYFTSGSGSTPFAQWKLMFERWVSFPDEIVKLSVDFGAANFEYVVGMLVNLTKGVVKTQGTTRWTVTIAIDPTSLSLS
jgi:hypothetical protein